MTETIYHLLNFVFEILQFYNIQGLISKVKNIFWEVRRPTTLANIPHLLHSLNTKRKLACLRFEVTAVISPVKQHRHSPFDISWLFCAKTQ